MAQPKKTSSGPTKFLLSCGCLLSTTALCAVCVAASVLVRPDLFGLEENLADLGLTAFDYDQVLQSMTGSPNPAVTAEFMLPTPEPIPTALPTSTPTPLPTFTPTVTPSPTPTVPVTDTPARLPTSTPDPRATDPGTATPGYRVTKAAAVIAPTATPGLPASPTPTATPSSTPTSTPTLVPLEFQQAQVVNVIDGDTIEVLIDGVRFQVQYLSITAPDRLRFAQEARALNEKLLSGSQTIRLGKDLIQADPQGRLWRYVYIENIMVNEELLRRGLARADRVPPEARFIERFSSLEREAQMLAVGLWGSTLDGSDPSPAAVSDDLETTKATPPAEVQGGGTRPQKALD